ncbi:Cell division protein FtsW [hydrothermal vent metagenome]|uniref:peptidoglycan glycosyltransferase n=1 Tax=hydrothermal vent metagenome TaxID=652676 RepID=A0A3B0VS99_9ZZZZ
MIISTKQASKTSSNSYLAVGVDFWLMFAAICIIAIGITMVASSSLAIAEKYNHDAFYYLKRHIIFIGIGTLLGSIILAIKMDWMQQLSRILIVIAIVLLILVLLPNIGIKVNGARRWINLGIARFQVVEAVKLAMIVYLAGYIVRHKHGLQHKFFGVIKPLLLAGVLSVLLLLQPDFGSAVLLLTITLFMVYIAGARYRDLTILGLISSSSMAYLAYAELYRLERLISFQNPWADPFNKGFQLVQALIAIGSGKISGVGIGGSVQKLFYLPEAHTDFIFSVYAEEMGFIGVMGLITLYIILIMRIFAISKVALNNGKEFAAFACAGIGVWVALQTFLSMGVNLGLLPTKGITLPFVSSGGSAIMMNLLSLAIVMRVSYENRRDNLKAIRKYKEATA